MIFIMADFRENLIFEYQNVKKTVPVCVTQILPVGKEKLKE